MPRSMKKVLLVTCVLALAALLAGVAIAATPSVTVVRAAHSPALGRTIVIDAHGRTLYVLSPETARHLLCKSSACVAVWPPLTVRSSHVHLKAGRGVQGPLGLLRRRSGVWQVTLRGLPLYRFAGDSARGQVNGEGIHSFGGIWHAARATRPHAAAAPAPAPAPMLPAY